MTKEEQTSEALRRADAALDGRKQQLERQAEDALAPLPPVFNSYSHAMALRLAAEQRTLQEEIAEIDEQLALLNAKRTDAMLAYSMATKGMEQREIAK